MSYCVNCGVELEKSQKKCPLCGTVVLNPNEPFDDAAVPPYPLRHDPAPLADRRMTVLLLSGILALPASICLVCNYILSAALTWSVFVVGAAAVVWITTVPPLIIRRGTLFWSIALDLAAVGVFLYFVNRFATPELSWFTPLALPVLMVTGFAVLVAAVLFRYAKLTKLHIAAVCLLLIGLLLVGIELITDAYLRHPVGLEWSPLVLIPCAILALIYLIIDRKKRLKSDLKKRLHM
jgi:hypothetical protein